MKLRIKFNAPMQASSMIRTWDAEGNRRDNLIGYDPQDTIKTAIDLIREQFPDAVAMELIISLPLKVEA